MTDGKVVTLPAAVPPFSWITHIDFYELYLKPGVFVAIQFWAGTLKLLPDPNWSRPTIPDPAFAAPEGNPDAAAPMIEDASATHPSALQFVRDGVLPVCVRRIEGADALVAIDAEAVAIATSGEVDPDGLNAYERAVMRAVWRKEAAAIAAAQ